jgi:prepilin-type processing-associated H-X9-DG protein
VQTLIYAKGYNTNYTASWYLVRSGPNLDTSGNLAISPNAPSGCKTFILPAIKDRNCSLGPLNQARLDRSAPGSQVPLLGCGNPSGAQLGVLMGRVQPTAPTAKSFTDGPVQNSNMQPPGSFPSGTPYNGATGWWAVWAKQTLQDYRGFGAVHGGGVRSCNILFADGSVRNYLDINGDGLLNNGFDPALCTTGATPMFKDNQVELPAIEVYSGYALQPQ